MWGLVISAQYQNFEFFPHFHHVWKLREMSHLTKIGENKKKMKIQIGIFSSLLEQHEEKSF